MCHPVDHVLETFLNLSIRVPAIKIQVFLIHYPNLVGDFADPVFGVYKRIWRERVAAEVPALAPGGPSLSQGCT